MPTLPCREDLAKLAQSYFRRTGNAAEVGTFQGGFAEHNLNSWKGRYYAVDAWAWRPDDPLDKNFKSQRVNDMNLKLVRDRTRRFGPRVRLVRNLSTDAARSFGDSTLDWIFLDALHTKEALLHDLRAWYPKLRAGGLISGDDYADEQLPPLVEGHAQPQLPLEQRDRYWKIPSQNSWGVMRATREFAREVGAVLQVSFLKGRGLLEHRVPSCYMWPAWYMVKPYADADAVAHALAAAEATLPPKPKLPQGPQRQRPKAKPVGAPQPAMPSSYSSGG